ncbi:hypothetical protein GCM10017772_20230 [Promicromonospora soli]|uniref:Uncharacterized protein n=1 Tax=Promicromonospora soli TaxID=2035533 RepID=A0A919KT48_9MICO|nr:hypothetical protein GCM10017772_20230 [Promicromonospora soli]
MVPMTFRYPTESPAESVAYWRRLRPQGAFVVGRFGPVLRNRRLALVVGCDRHRTLSCLRYPGVHRLDHRPTLGARPSWHRGNLRPRLIALGFAFGAAILLQGIVGVTLGTWPATALAPVAFAVEFLIARERLRTRAANKDKR